MIMVFESVQKVLEEYMRISSAKSVKHVPYILELSKKILKELHWFRGLLRHMDIFYGVKDVESDANRRSALRRN